MSTILLVPRTKKEYDELKPMYDRMMAMAEKAAQKKTHFVITIDPEEFEVFAVPGIVEEILPDQSGSIRVNLTMFQDALEVPSAGLLGSEEGS